MNNKYELPKMITIENTQAMQIGNRMNVGDYVKHFKRELLSQESLDYIYQIRSLAGFTRTAELLVIYASPYTPNQVYACPYDDFISKIDTDKYPNIKQKFQFEKCSSEEVRDIFYNYSVNLLNEKKFML